MIRIKPLVAAVSCAASLNAVADIQRMFVLGDSLSDGGTYTQPVTGLVGVPDTLLNVPIPASAIPDRLSFVNNQQDQELWVDVLASELGLNVDVDTLNGLFDGTNVLISVQDVDGGLDGTNYAEGGSQVISGEQNNNRFNISEISLQTQITRLLDDVDDRLTSDDLVTVWIGANDVFEQATNVGGGLDPTTAVVNMVTAAAQAGQQLDRLKAAGATNIVVVTIPDMGTTPLARAQDQATLALAPNTPADSLPSALLTALSDAYNNAFAPVAGQKGAVVVDSGKLLNAVISDPGRYGFNNDPTAAMTPYCGDNGNPDPSLRFPSSLSCIEGVTVAAQADGQIFADGVHPTLQSHALFGQAVIASLESISFAESFGYSAHRATELQLSELRRALRKDVVTGESDGITVTPFIARSSSEKDASQLSRKEESNNSAVGVMVGLINTPETSMGIAMSRGTDKSESLGDVKSQTTNISAYGKQSFAEKFYLQGLLSLGFGGLESTRVFDIASSKEINTGDTDVNSTALEMSFGTDYSLGEWDVSSGVGMRMAKTTTKSFAEDDSATSIAYGQMQMKSKQLVVSSEFTRSLFNGWALSISGDLIEDLSGDHYTVKTGPSLGALSTIQRDKRDGSFIDAMASVHKQMNDGLLSVGVNSRIGEADTSTVGFGINYSIAF